jgi:hypothetical protein
VEIYNEQIKDLLQPSNNGNLDVREAPGRGTFVAGATVVAVHSRDDVEMLLEAGNAFRTTESTQLNMVSSRSHAVLQLRLEIGDKNGKLSLIDLAGSERASKTGVMSSTNNIGRGGTQNNSKRLNEASAAHTSPHPPTPSHATTRDQHAACRRRAAAVARRPSRAEDARTAERPSSHACLCSCAGRQHQQIAACSRQLHLDAR